MFENFFDGEMIQALIYIGATFLALFMKAFLDAVKPGKPDGKSQQLALWFIRKIINKVSPEELGRKVALKVNPASPNARRISDDKKFTKRDSQILSSAVIDARLTATSEKHLMLTDGWDF